MEIIFKDVTYSGILKKINLVLKDGEVTSIVGKNGSGKTAFLDLIFNYNLKKEGNIIIDNIDINSKTTKKNLQKTKSNIIYLKQDFSNQLYCLSILDDIKQNLTNIDYEKLNELLKMFNLSSDILKKNYLEISEGEKKKILLIIIFMSKNKIILLDDPTNDLDQKGISTLIKLLKKEKRSGKIIIISSADHEFILNIADKIILIDNKKMIEINNKYDFFTNEKLLNKCRMFMPKVLEFRETVLKIKNKKLLYRDNINDLIKDIYRYVK